MANLAIGAAAPRTHGPLPTALLRLAPHDWLLVVYHVIFLAAALTKRSVSTAPIVLISIDFAFVVGLLVVVRAFDMKSPLVSTLYRASLIAIPIASYLQLRWLLPVLAPRSVDAHLLAFDLRVFGYEPSIEWDAFVNPLLTEWLSFFYYSYFALLALHAFPIALFAKDGAVLHEFAFGILFLFCIGHIGYLVVPGEGPHVYVSAFERPIEGATFWPLVRDTVAKAGAQADIFPSLHTAVPTFLTLYSFRHRDRAPFKYTWPALGFFASQIIVATMYLRWHWLADIVAGLILATTAALLAPRLSKWDTRRRLMERLSPAFTPALDRRHHAHWP